MPRTDSALRRSTLGSESRVLDAFRNRPPWLDGILARRLLAGLLALLAGALFLRGDPGAARTEILVASRDIAPGSLLTDTDLRAAAHPLGTLPDGVVRDSADLLGATLTGAMRASEVFTDVRTVNPRLAGVATGSPDARIVPLRLANSAVADILRAGDRVDVIGAASDGAGRESDRPPRTLATDAAVVLVSAAGDGRSAERVVLVAMDTGHATAVAAASLSSALTVVFH
ncbi:SAF domain-containing protein [Nocardia asteroides]|uniref:SAF domain-containing protein n=1 Tax=Nocardia asteroides TaxID=1824 RepID=UPI001E3B9893|nr:SAF domain-containing protein [Nocardia asteroides]UGT64445.1 SAF domain-containing protein [Nocardia asteroides]